MLPWEPKPNKNSGQKSGKYEIDLIHPDHGKNGKILCGLVQPYPAMCFIGHMSYTDSVVPDQTAHQPSLT